MPFRYVKDAGGKPVMPKVSPFIPLPMSLKIINHAADLPENKGMIDLIKKDSEKGFGDLL